MATSPYHLQGRLEIDHYAIRRKLGSGSMGSVYLAEDRRDGRAVALKVLRVDRFSSRAVERLRGEFKAIATLHHPQIATAFDFGYSRDNRLPYYTREYIEGTPLPPGPPGGAPPHEFLRPVLDLLDAVEYLHAHEILHLDIHPGNLIVAGDRSRGSVLIDFGLLRSFDGPQLSTAPHDFPNFPPELLRGGKAGPAADIYLAGRLLLYRITGDAAGEARLPREVPGWGPRRTLELERIAAKALHSDPAQRFRTAGEFRTALARAIGEAPREAKPIEPGEVTVGREAELQRIDDVLDRTADGEAAVLWITGAPGLGRSRLLGEARLRAQLQGLDVVLARFFPDQGTDPTLTSALSGATLQASSRNAGRKTRPRRKRPQWLSFLAAEHGGTPEERARRAAKGFFEEEGRPLVLLLDDFDRADAASRTLAEAFLAEAAERLARREKGRGLGVVVSTARPPTERPWRRQAIRLRPLRPAKVRELLRILVRPLILPEKLSREAASLAGGFPLRLRQIALALSVQWRRAGTVPKNAELPPLPVDAARGGLGDLAGLHPADRAVLAALAVLRRPARSNEVAAAVEISPKETSRRLRRLERAELVSAFRAGGARFHRPSRVEMEADLRREVSEGETRRIHRRLVKLIEREARADLAARENLARHLLRAGERARGLRLARETAGALRNAGAYDRAVGLLEEALAGEADPRRAFAFAEDVSSILEEVGDHRRGAAVLDPIYRQGIGRLSSNEAIRLRRRLGVHWHRSGQVEDALRIFEEAQRLADPARDIEDLIFIDSELAEIHNVRGSYERSDAACRRGLARLEKIKGEFSDRMELILRASRGHLELRRMNLPTARSELKAALRLSRRFRMPALRAVIFNNLGIAENQLNEFAAAGRSFRAAERLLSASGERRPLVAIACNHAMIAAKLGDRDEAQAQVERAAQLVRRSPGRRIEFFVDCARGVVACCLGDVGETLEALPRALASGRQIGDLHLTRLAEVSLAEALIACGRYGQAIERLREAAESAEPPPAVARMVQSRLFFLSRILGNRRLAGEAEKRLEEIPRSDVELLEAWNDLWVGFARVFSGERAAEELLAARDAFGRLKIVFGERFARLGLLMDALQQHQRAEIEARLKDLDGEAAEAHRLLAVAIPLVRAEALFFLGDAERAREKLAEASGAIVGSPFLELDWRIELLRARLALKDSDAAAARGYLHRSIHTRHLLLQLVPARWRARFLAHGRFAALHELGERLERSPRLAYSSRRFQSAGGFEGMVGRSAGMVQVFRTIDRLRDQEISVLIAGETGTGKELVARALHRTSLRAKGPFLAVHCASLPVELFESEMFGYEAGAFTGAEESRPGLLESLKGGTLLLDEVAELPLEAQAKLLRVLESSVVRRLGGTEERSVDVRFLASTSAAVKPRVDAHSFRADLFYRLAGMEIAVPPLRKRRDDVALLARHAIEKHSQRLGRPAPALREDARKLLEAQAWPGNVRELETVLLRALVSLSGPEPLGAGSLAPFLSAARGPESEDSEPAGESLFNEKLLEGRSIDELHAELERAYLTSLFRRAKGDLSSMAEALGVKLSGLYTRLKKAGIKIRALRKGS